MLLVRFISIVLVLGRALSLLARFVHWLFVLDYLLNVRLVLLVLVMLRGIDSSDASAGEPQVLHRHTAQLGFGVATPRHATLTGLEQLLV